MRTILGTAILAPLIPLLSAQAPGTAGEDVKLRSTAASHGLALPVETTVHDNVSVQAVLLPPGITKGLFGGAVSDRYAAIQLIISNHSQEASMILQSIFIDYSRWLLSGSAGDRPAAECQPRRPPPPQPGAKPEEAVPIPGCENPPESYEAQTKPNQIASTEYRLPRGQLLNAQPWTARNITIRALEAAGALAAGYVFPFKEVGIAKGIAAYNGNFLPAARYFWPDSTVEQLNRISDLGFRVNTVVPRQSSAIVVAFFALDRFLTQGLKEIYLKSPAVFFVPHAALLDPKDKATMDRLLEEFGPGTAAKVRKELVSDLKAGKVSPGSATQLLNRVSLNRVRVLVGGSMSVDLDTIPASIDAVEFEGAADAVQFWTEPGGKAGVVRGRFLSGGTVTIAEANRLGITDLATAAEGAGDTSLRFTFRTTKAIPPGQKLTFRVNKKNKDGKAVDGVEHQYQVEEYRLLPPEIGKVDLSGTALTIAGRRFFSTSDNPITVSLRPGSVAGVDPVSVKNFERTPTQIKVDLAPLNLKPACWTPEVSVGTMTSPGSHFAQPPKPRIKTAKKSGSRIVVAGEDFIDLAACGKPLRFQLVEQKEGAEPAAASNVVILSANEAAMDLPAKPENAKWRVRILLAGVEAAIQAVE